MLSSQTLRQPGALLHVHISLLLGRFIASIFDSAASMDRTAGLISLLDSSSEDEDLMDRQSNWLSSSSSNEDDLELLLEERIIPKNEAFFKVIANFDDQSFLLHFRVSRKDPPNGITTFSNGAFKSMPRVHWKAEAEGQGHLNE